MWKIEEILVASQIENIGEITLRKIISNFESLENLLSSSEKFLEKALNQNFVEGILSFNNSKLDKAKKNAERQVNIALKTNSTIISIEDELYPEQLKNIYSPPVLIFTKGNFLPQDRFSISIVGTRNPTNYGKIICEKLSEELAHFGLTIISGLAYGIDTIAHKSAVKNSKRTIAVLGSGVDIIYPKENISLAKEIEKNGVIVSEYFFETPANSFNFPKRNRIISGLSFGTILIESSIDGGGIITMKTALDQGKDTFAIPGSILENKSSGTNLLIKEGKAKLVQNVDDILNELNYKLQPFLGNKNFSYEKINLSEREKLILSAMPNEPIHIDEIASILQISVSEILVNFLNLEFKGVIKQFAGKMFQKIL